MSLAIQYLQSGKRLERLPLAILYLTERCNSRCVTCDYWRTGRVDMTLDSVERLLPSLVRLGTQVVLISGGEPLINPQWRSIARLLVDSGMRLWLLTSGLSLVNRVRFQSAQRSTSVMPAIWAMRSSSAGHAYRPGNSNRST